MRSSPSFLASALESPKASFIPLDSLQPLCKNDKDGVRRLLTIKWTDVQEFIGDPKQVFHGVDGKRDEDVPELAILGKEAARLGKSKVGELSPQEKRQYFLNQVRSAPVTRVA